jgi:hypothetical protein
MERRFRRGFTAAEKTELWEPLAAWGVFEGDWPSVWVHDWLPEEQLQSQIRCPYPITLAAD